jgi:hypothetical protein
MKDELPRMPKGRPFEDFFPHDVLPVSAPPLGFDETARAIDRTLSLGEAMIDAARAAKVKLTIRGSRIHLHGGGTVRVPQQERRGFARLWNLIP